MQFNLVKSVDVSCCLSPLDTSQALAELNYIFLNKLYCQDPTVVPFQTYPTLFEKDCSCFVNIKQSFLYACSIFCAKDVSNRFTKAWGYQTKGILSKNERKAQWHTHDSASLDISGVLYLKTNFKETKAGTEFLYNNKNHKVKPLPLTWVLFPPFILHRPGFNFFGKTRISIAANLYAYTV
jgi:hypothetical protein